MSSQSHPTTKLVQFKCKDNPISDLVRKLADEKLGEWEDRKKRNRELPPPENHFRHTGVIPQKLLQILRDEKLRLVDAYFQRRIGGNEEMVRVRRHSLVTFKFAASSPNDAKRQRDLDDRGMRVLHAYLDQRWERVVVASFAAVPGLQSILFVGSAEDPTNAVDIEDPDAEKFGMIVTRRNTAPSEAA